MHISQPDSNSSIKYLLKKIKKNKNSTLIFFGPDEYCLQTVFDWKIFLSTIVRALEKNNVVLEFWIGNQDTNAMYNFILSNRIKLINWSTYQLYSSLHLADINLEYKPDKLFITTNRRPVMHRCYLMDKLAEADLIHNNYVSWKGVPCKYKFKFFENKKMILDKPPIYNSEYFSKAVPDQYFSAFFNLISESCADDYLDISEKTFNAIFLKQIFLTIGPRYLYKKLTEWGFVLYDEIFDYDFDNLETIKDRTDHVVSQISKLKITNYTAARTNLQNKIDHNYNNALKIANDKSSVPPDFFSYYESFLSDSEDEILDQVYNLFSNR